MLARDDHDGTLDLRVRLDQWQVNRLQQEGVEVVVVPGEERRAAG